MNQVNAVIVENRAVLNQLFHDGEIQPDVMYIDTFMNGFWKLCRGGGGFVEVKGVAGLVFPGDKLFQLKATHGLPLEDALAKIFDAGYTIDWCGFMAEARKNGWWDFQTLQVIEDALLDNASAIVIERTLYKLKCWIMENRSCV